MADVKLVAEQRTKFGKGAARSARRDGNVPAVIYSRGGEATHILIDGHQAFLTVLKDLRSLIEIDLDGEKHTVIIKSVQRDAVGRVLEHIDFLAVVKGERAANDIPVVIVGEPTAGTQAQLELTTVNVEADVAALPEHVEIDITGIPAGTNVTLGDVKLPEGQVFVTDLDLVVLIVSEAAAAVEEEEEEAPAAE